MIDAGSRTVQVCCGFFECACVRLSCSARVCVVTCGNGERRYHSGPNDTQLFS